MNLCLSSATAPDATLTELASAARRRGLHALELVQGDAHGLLPPVAPRELEHAVAALAERHVRVSALRCLDPGTAAHCGAVARELGALLVVAGIDAAAFPERLQLLCDAGMAPVLAFSQPQHLLDAVACFREQPEVAFAWDVRPGQYPLAEAADAVLAAAGPRLRHMRLYGGGPEAIAQEGLGVGALMSRLAMGGYEGSFALAPTDSRSRVVWNAWLGRRGGWGCGSKTGGHAALPTAVLEA